jgi:hypothetical protein
MKVSCVIFLMEIVNQMVVTILVPALQSLRRSQVAMSSLATFTRNAFQKVILGPNFIQFSNLET